MSVLMIKLEDKDIDTLQIRPKVPKETGSAKMSKVWFMENKLKLSKMERENSNVYARLLTV